VTGRRRSGQTQRHGSQNRVKADRETKSSIKNQFETRSQAKKRRREDLRTAIPHRNGRTEEAQEKKMNQCACVRRSKSGGKDRWVASFPHRGKKGSQSTPTLVGAKYRMWATRSILLEQKGMTRWASGKLSICTWRKMSTRLKFV